MGFFRLFGYFSDDRLDSAAIHRIVGETANVVPMAERGELRVVSWNIRYGSRFDRVAEQIRRLDADIYVLQEVDLFCRRSGNRNVAKDLADLIGANWVFAGEFQEIGQSTGGVPALTGQAILSRYPITEASAIPFRAQTWARWRLNPIQPRRGGRLALRATTAGVDVYNAHLESGRHDRLRRRQLEEVLGAAASDRETVPSLLAGDFNNGPNVSAVFQAMTTAGFTNVLPPGADRQVTRPHRAYPIDWIFTRQLRATAGQVVRVEGASDHYPITTTVRSVK